MTRSTTICLAIAAGFGCLAAGFLSGCATSPAPDSAYVVCFFDASQSAAARREAYLQDFASIVSQLRGGDSLAVSLITENTLATGTVPLRAEFPLLNRWIGASPRAYNEAIKASRSELRQRAAALLQHAAHTPHTAILDSLLLAQKLFHSAKARSSSKRLLVVFSDMLEDSAQCSFENRSPGAAFTRQFIDDERRAGRIPDLTSVLVYVGGATPNPMTDAEKIRQVETFWQTYFHAAGATFTGEHYGASLLDFSLHGGND